MEKQRQKEFTSISIRKIEHKKLNKFKIHANQPMWEVIKKFIEDVEVKEKPKKMFGGPI